MKDFIETVLMVGSLLLIVYGIYVHKKWHKVINSLEKVVEKIEMDEVDSIENTR